MKDARIRDLDGMTHEAGHAVAVTVHGGQLIRVCGSRHYAGAGEAGFVEYIGAHLSAWQHGFISLAGRAVADGLDVLVDRNTQDEREAVQLVGAELMPTLRAAVAAWALRLDVRRAVAAVSGELLHTPVIAGIPVEALVWQAINPRQAHQRPA